MPRPTPLSSFTKMQQIFIRLIVEGLPGATAARTAGYAHPVEDAWHLMQLAHVRQAVQERREALFTGELGTKAMRTLDWCLEFGPPIVRLNAAKFTLQVAGIVEKTKFNSAEPGKKSLIEMSEAELIEYVNGQQKQLLVLEAGDVKNVSNTSEIDELLS